MITQATSYHKQADKFVHAYFENNAASSIYYSYRFISQLAKEAKKIAKANSLTGMDYQSVIVAVWFRYVGVTNIALGRTEEMNQILTRFFIESDYPLEERIKVEKAINFIVSGAEAATIFEQIISDAIYSQLANNDILENILLLQQETNRLNGNSKEELDFDTFFLNIFIKTRYYTGYAIENYAVQKQKNFQLLEKRIDKLKETEKKNAKDNYKTDGALLLNNKETEDFFKLAFRNYNHLISVADSKASLLINVNSIIISIMLAFVLSRIEKNMFLLWPAIMLLSVCTITILLSILASRPQQTSCASDKQSNCYQKFFFGSFDLIDKNFTKVNWEEYFIQLNDLFSQPRENVYIEVYKESFNVRKVLSRKFNYLSIAYWVFLAGLTLSIVAFIISIYSKTITL
jgi:hypothetical protein